MKAIEVSEVVRMRREGKKADPANRDVVGRRHPEEKTTFASLLEDLARGDPTQLGVEVRDPCLRHRTWRDRTQASHIRYPGRMCRLEVVMRRSEGGRI